MVKFKPEIIKNENQTFFLILFLTFANEDVFHDFKVGFKAYQAYVRNNEPYTLQFEMAQSDQSEKRLIVIERYSNKDRDYLRTHRKSLDICFLEIPRSRLGTKGSGEDNWRKFLGSVVIPIWKAISITLFIGHTNLIGPNRYINICI